MKKYWLVFQQEFSQFTSYRLQMLVQILQSFFVPLLMVIILTHAGSNNSFSASNLISYYLLVSLFYPLTVSEVDETIAQDADTGQVNNFLIKPISYFRWLLFQNASQKIALLLTILPFIVLIFILNKFSPGSALAVVISLVLSFLLSFSFSFLIGQFHFWIDEFWAIQNVKFVLIQFFSGVVLPYTLFPESLVKILRYTPFPYIAGWPARIVQGRLIFLDFVIALIWVLIMYFASALFHRRAVLKYSHVGS